MPIAGFLKYERCSVEHCDILHQIALKAYKEHYTGIWDDHGQAYLERFYAKHTFEMELRDEACQYYLIYYLETPVGFLKLLENGLPPNSPEDCLEVNKIYILEAYTGKGIGSSTLQFVFNIARAKHKRILWLNVMEESKAKRFYENLGFRCCHEFALDYPHMKAGLNVLGTYQLELPKFQRISP